MEGDHKLTEDFVIHLMTEDRTTFKSTARIECKKGWPVQVEQNNGTAAMVRFKAFPFLVMEIPSRIID